MVVQDKPQLQEQQAASQAKIPFQEYLKAYDGVRAEWLMGEVAVYVTNNVQHQEILRFLATLFDLFLEVKSLGRVLLAGVSMYISDEQPAREPDLLIVLNEHLERIQATYLNGPADIAIEIVSPDSTERDRGDKFTEYEKAGVPEYWLLDPLRQEARIYVLGEDRFYHPAPLDAQGRLISTLLPGFALDAAILWQEKLPRGREITTLVEQMV